jgi:hypothetical protein
MPAAFLYVDTTHIAVGIQYHTFSLITGIIIEIPTDFAAKQGHRFA